MDGSSIYSLFRVARDAVTLAGRLADENTEIVKKINAKRSNLRDSSSIFLENSFTNSNEICGKTGHPREAERKKVYDDYERAAIDSRNIAENLAWDLQTNIELIDPILKHQGIDYNNILETDNLKREIQNTSGFVIGGPVPNATSDYCLRKLNEAGFDVGFDLSDPHYPLSVEGHRYEPEYNERKNTYEKDWSLFIRMPNPRRNEQTYILNMGCKAYGTKTISKLFRNPDIFNENIAELFNDVYGTDPFYAVFEVYLHQNTQDYIQEIKLIEHDSLTEYC